MRPRKRRQLTKRELRALGATPGLVTTRYTPDGERARLEQLTPEGADRPFFDRRLTSQIDTNERS